MRRLTKVGAVAPKSAKEVTSSHIGIGFEKLDRALFNPEKAYDKVAAIGVKWIRLQTGWQRTEKVKGEYDFSWLDEIVDNLIARGLKPWFCLAWGSKLYTEFAARFFGAVGCPPVDSDEEKRGWCAYCTKLAEHFAGRIEYYEVWNEPDCTYSWRHEATVQGTLGTPSGTEYGEFVNLTSPAIKAGDKNAKIIAFGLGSPKLNMNFVADAFKTGIADHIDAASYHIYATGGFERALYGQSFIDTVHHFAPHAEIIQGESGGQSSPEGCGALRWRNWDETKQAKFLIREIVTDISLGLKFTSYFSAMDMAEALHGMADEKRTCKDYGYFGVIGAEFDDDGVASGEYHEKPSYYALQTLASLFAEEYENISLPVLFAPELAKYINAWDTYDSNVDSRAFRLADGRNCFAYWYNSNLLSESVESVTTIEVLSDKVPQLIDPMDGSIYEFPADLVEQRSSTVKLYHIPIRDYPLLLVW